jgi:hypothetical protein
MMRRTLGSVAVLAVLAAGCSTPPDVTTAPTPTAVGQGTVTVPATTPTPDSTTTTTMAVQDPEVNQVLANYSSWTTPTKVSSDSRSLTDTSWTTPASGTTPKVQTACLVDEPHTISRTFDELAAFPFGGQIAPGLIVEGGGVTEGDLRVLPLDRAPLTLISSLDSANPVVGVDEPTGASLQEAVSQLKRDADTQLTGIDVTPADITYTREETHSFEESFLGMGMSLHYASPAVQARFDSSFEQEQSTDKHSIVVSLVQPMFTIRIDQSGVRSPGDHLDVSTTTDEIDALAAQGRISADAPPVIIDSVTYGRVMYFTMTSSTVASSTDLELAVEAAWGNIGGNASLKEEQLKVLSQSRIELIAIGGDQDVALGAIRSGQLSDFFARVNTTTAAPITMTLRTLDGDIVNVADEATLQSVSCSDEVLPYEFTVEVRNLNGKAIVQVNDQEITSFANASGVQTAVVPANQLRPGGNTLKIEYSDWFPCVGSSITASILVDQSRVPGSTLEWNAPACWFEIVWDIDTTTGTVTKRP